MLTRLHNRLLLLFLLLCSLASSQQDHYLVTSITVMDNKVTHESIILRELTFKAGDTINTADLENHISRSANNVFNTRLFNFVEVIPNPIEGGYIEFIVKVTERWYIWPIFVLDFADPNFNTWWQTKDFTRLNYGLGAYLANFRGRKEKLAFIVQLGYSKQFGLSYEIPYITRKQNLGVGLSYSFTQQAQITYATQDNKRLFLDGIDGKLQSQHLAKLNFTYRNDLYNKVSLELRYTNMRVDDTLLTVSDDYFTPGSNAASYFGIIGSYTHDKRNNVSYPLTGYAFGASLIKYGVGFDLEDDLNVFYTILNARGHWRLAEKWYGALSLRGKITANGELPYYIQEGFGYNNFVRGYELYVVDGQHYLLGKSNLKYELLSPKRDEVQFIGMNQFSKFHYSLYLNLFADVGRVWDGLYYAQNTLANETLFGWGAGIDFVTYYDKVLRLEYSFNSIGESGLFLHFVKSF